MGLHITGLQAVLQMGVWHACMSVQVPIVHLHLSTRGPSQACLGL